MLEAGVLEAGGLSACLIQEWHFQSKSTRSRLNSGDSSLKHQEPYQMPNYEFRCPHCLHEWDALLPIAQRNQPLVDPCPHCAAPEGVQRRWDTPPETGADAALKPQSGFTQRMEAIAKHHGRHKPHVRQTIARALDGRAKRYGRQ